MTPPPTLGMAAVPPPVDDSKCPCCGGPRHANQKNADKTTATIITEEQWYGPDGYKKVQEARGKGCNNVPANPDDGKCGAYYLQRSSKQAGKSRKSFNDKGGKLEYATTYNAVHAADIAAGKRTPITIQDGVAGEPICHKVPNSAGGCGDGTKLDQNLERKADLSPECQKLDDDLTDIHTARAMHWQNPANVP
jgi:hypothetical protein